MDINRLLQGVDCSCGRHHACDIRYVYVERDAARHLPNICADHSEILLVADENTYAAAARGVIENIGSKITRRVIFTGEKILVPDEKAIAKVTDALGNADLIVGIGSGVIQDLCKYVSYKSNLPYVIVATAPSMDGYASSGAAMITDGMKVTYSAGVPMAIVADTEVLRNAPLEMIKAGYGDIIGKYSALNDWKLGALINGEYFCDYVYSLTYDMLLAVLPLARRLLERDEDATRTLMEALILVGVAMSFAGNSRPASGSEHHLSHFFEITGIVHGKEYLPHGIDVIYSTAITAKVREVLSGERFPALPTVISESRRNAETERLYGSVGAGCIALQEKLGTYKTNRHEKYLKLENEIKNVLSEMPPYEKIVELIGDIGLELNEFFTLYGKNHVRDAIRYAKDLKDRYTVLWMLYDIYGEREII